jgi:hypothetical protein
MRLTDWRDLATASVLLAAGIVIGLAAAPQPAVSRALALGSLADESFAVCTVPLSVGVEGIFMLDFETGDLSGGVINPTTRRFMGAYKHNVLADLGFKAGQVKNPKFLLVSGGADMAAAGGLPLASSLLYVTDSSTGTTVAYGIPWNSQQAAPASVGTELLPLDVARPRGGGTKAVGAKPAVGVKPKDR